MDQGQQRTWSAHTGQKANPVIQLSLRHDMRIRTRCVGGYAHRSFSEKRWVCNSVVVRLTDKPHLAQNLARLGDISLNHTKTVAEAIPFRIRPSQRALSVVDLNAGNVDTGNARHKA
jgi:hypothetical protein